jgi:TniQ
MRTKAERLVCSAEPLTDESMMGYLLRLVERNDYDHLSWLLQMAEIRDYVHTGCCFIFDNSLNLTPLSRITGVEEAKLSALLYHPAGAERRKMGDYLVFGSPVPQYVIRPKSPKICPRCLRESAHARRIWDLIPVTVCPIHKCLLLDECPNCRARLTWIRTSVSHCRCEFDWSKYKPRPVDEPELAIAKQIHRLCKLKFGKNGAVNHWDQSNPLYKLNLRYFFSALFFVASQYGGFNDTKGKFFASKRNAEIHKLLCQAFLAFNNWPNNFFSFLDWRRTQKVKEKFAHGLRREFGEYKAVLYGQLSAKPLDFLRRAFEDYIVERWDGGYTSHMRRLNDDALGKKKYVSMDEAKRLLNTPLIYGLISSGSLKAIMRREGEKNFVLVERASLEELKDELGQALGISQLSQVLMLQRMRIFDLIEAELLKPLRGPSVDGCADWKFSLAEAEGLLKNFRNNLMQDDKSPKGKSLTFKQLLVRLDRFGVNLSAFIQAVLRGEVRPCGLSKRKGLQNFLFADGQVSEFLQNNSQIREESYSVQAAAKILDTDMCLIYSLIKKGFIHAQKTSGSGPLIVRKSDLETFTSTFTLIGKIARKLDTHSNYLVALLEEQGVKPVSGPMVDGGLKIVFKKSDLDAIDLGKLVSSAKSESKRFAVKPKRSTSPLNEAEAAEALGVDVSAIRQFAERGIVKPLRFISPTRTVDGGYYFSKSIIERHKELSLDYRKLFMHIEVMKLFNIQRETLLKKYVRTGRLTIVAEFKNGKHGRLYFRMEDVKALSEIEKQTIITPEAAEILGVYVSVVNKLIDSGDLKPISGPNVDGFGKNLFLRSDVEELRRQREAFKAKRIEEGGSARFGRQAGSKASPVKDLIGPRIEQLIEEWKKEMPNKQIIGRRLYHQLVGEGHQLGIVTVYEYLRRRHLKAA